MRLTRKSVASTAISDEMPVPVLIPDIWTYALPTLPGGEAWLVVYSTIPQGFSVAEYMI